MEPKMQSWRRSARRLDSGRVEKCFFQIYLEDLKLGTTTINEWSIKKTPLAELR